MKPITEKTICDTCPRMSNKKEGKKKSCYTCLSELSDTIDIKNKNDKHSPLPWKKEENKQHIIVDNIGECIVTFGLQENANYILDACNNYEALQTNYNNLLQQCEGQAGVIEAKNATIDELQKQINDVKEIFPDLLNLISSHGVDGARQAIENIFPDIDFYIVPFLNRSIEDELEAAKR